jgi:hypothetical protein
MGEVLADVPHRQWVFTIPKRLRVYFRYDRSLLGKLCRAAYDTVCDVFKLEIDGDSGTPAMIGGVQTFGDLIHWHPHIHAIVPEGVFTESGCFVPIPDIWKHRAVEIWQGNVFALLLAEHKITDDVVANMRTWKHSGFSVDNSVYVAKDDKEGMLRSSSAQVQRLIEYIARCPFSLTRMVSITKDGKILYRAAHANCVPFPLSGDATLMAGIPRNFEVFDPLDFLAEVTQHIPNKGEHQIRYYGWYSNKKRGMQEKKKPKPQMGPGSPEPDTPYRRKCRITWAALIKAVYEVDPLKCPKCGGTMKIVSFIEEDDVICKILKHCGLWKETSRPPPKNDVAPFAETGPYYDFSFTEPACESLILKKPSAPLCPKLVFTAEIDVVRSKFEEIAHWWLLNRVVHSTEIAGKLTLEEEYYILSSEIKLLIGIGESQQCACPEIVCFCCCEIVLDAVPRF